VSDGQIPRLSDPVHDLVKDPVNLPGIEGACSRRVTPRRAHLQIEQLVGQVISVLTGVQGESDPCPLDFDGKRTGAVLDDRPVPGDRRAGPWDVSLRAPGRGG